MRNFLLALLLLPSLSFAEKAGVVGSFKGLHNSESSILIDDNEAQDLSNVDFSPNGKAILKRDGYASFQSVGVATHPVTGGYFFKDVDGEEIIVAVNDGKVYKSESGGTFSAFITTDTSGAFYDFTDSQGILWRANSAKDEIVSYNGSAKTYYPSAPKGNQIEVLPDRAVISGTDANPNRLNFSASADFTNYVTASLETSPFTEDIFLPGQDIVAIKAACGGVIAWTFDRMSLWTGTSQYDGQIVQISETIGTNQPSTIVNDLGVTYWQGQDGHWYSYDCNGVARISSNIDVSNFVTGRPKNWTQTSQEDWDAGTLTYVTSDITVGDVMLSTWTDTDTTTADFEAFSSSSNVTITNNQVQLSTNNVDLTNPGFEAALGAEWTTASGAARSTTQEQAGSWSLDLSPSGCSPLGGMPASALQDSSGATLVSITFTSSPGAWTQKTVSMSAYTGRWVRLSFAGGRLVSEYFLASGTDITFYYYGDPDLCQATGLGFLDTFEGGRSTTYSGTFTSQTFDTALGVGRWLASDATRTANGHSVTFQTQSSANGSSWESAASWTPGSAPTSTANRYIRYVVTMSTGGTTNGTALPYLSDATLSARASSGTFTSQTKNIGANATSFGNFVRDQTLNSGTIGYFIRTATTEGGLSAASWTAMTHGSQISATIRPWIQIKSTFTATTATYNPTMHSFVINWNEGTIARHWGIVDKDHRLAWSVAENADTVPSVSYIYDQRFGSWLKYSFPFYAPARSGDSIYFGSPSAGTVYQYPSGTSDNGSAITAYWKSKDFVGSDPFVESDYNNWSFLGKAETGSNLDITYTVDTITATSRNFSLTDPNSLTIRRLNDYFPSGTYGSFINFKFGNNDADAPFEIYGFTYDYDNRPWRVME